MAYPKIPPKKKQDNLIIHAERNISAPIETVFRVISNPILFVELESVVQDVKIISKTRGQGMITRWTIIRPDTNEEFITDEECVHFEPPYQFAYCVIKGIRPYAGVHTLSSNSDGSTHHEFNEVFYYDADPKEKRHTIDGLMDNVKLTAEKLAKT